MRGASRTLDRKPVPFRFDAIDHRYIALDTGAEIPHVTGMLARTVHIDDKWFTEESSQRGIAVHALTARFDLEVRRSSLASAYRGPYRAYLRAYAQAIRILQPIISAVEEPRVHSGCRFAGCPDREIQLNGVRGVMEIKTGSPHKAHALQTALQAILVAPGTGLPPEALGRWVLYLRPTGRFRLVACRNIADMNEAYRIIRRCC